MHRRSGFLAALVAAFCLTAPAAALAVGPDLKTSVSGSPNPVAAGQYVSLQIVTDNTGGQTAQNVVVKAFLPAKTMYIPGDSECKKVGNEVHCAAGDIPQGGNHVNEVVLRLLDFSQAGYFQAFVTAHHSVADADPSDDGSHTNISVYNHSHDHQLGGVQKKEEHISAPAFSGIVEKKLNCDPGYVAIDGGYRLDNVDQGTGTARDVSVLGSFSDGDGWKVKIVNYATGQAQGKIFAVCLPKTTQGANADNNGPHHTHNVVLGGVKKKNVAVVAGQKYDVEVSCNAGPNDYVVAVAPGYGVSGAEGFLNASQPGYDANGRPAWDFGFTATQTGNVEFSIRCLNRWLAKFPGDNHSHELWLSHVDGWFDIAPNAPYGTYRLTCSDEAKGIVGGWKFDDGLYPMGNDPQPKSRDFRILNDSNSTKKAHLFLLCLGDRSGTDPPPPVAPEAVSQTATATGSKLAVSVTCPAGGCGGTIELLAASTGSRAKAAAAGKVIGRATFKGGQGRVKVRVPVAKKYRSAVANGQIRSVTAVVRKHSGAVAKRVKLRVSR